MLFGIALATVLYDLGLTPIAARADGQYVSSRLGAWNNLGNLVGLTYFTHLDSNGSYDASGNVSAGPASTTLTATYSGGSASSDYFAYTNATLTNTTSSSVSVDPSISIYAYASAYTRNHSDTSLGGSGVTASSVNNVFVVHLNTLEFTVILASGKTASFTGSCSGSIPDY